MSKALDQAAMETETENESLVDLFEVHDRESVDDLFKEAFRDLEQEKFGYHEGGKSLHPPPIKNSTRAWYPRGEEEL